MAVLFEVCTDADSPLIKARRNKGCKLSIWWLRLTLKNKNGEFLLLRLKSQGQTKTWLRIPTSAYSSRGMAFAA